MKQPHNYILLVDNHRRPSRQRNTAGRYRVCAKDEKQAEELLREKIGFGAILVYYQCRDDDKNNLPYKSVMKEESYTEDGVLKVRFVEPRHATAPQPKEDEYER
jgi:hypothetical protein